MVKLTSATTVPSCPTCKRQYQPAGSCGGAMLWSCGCISPARRPGARNDFEVGGGSLNTQTGTVSND